MLLLSMESPVVTEIVEASLEEWGTELLAMRAPRQRDAPRQIRENMRAKVLDQMDTEYNEALRKGVALSVAPAMNWPDLNLAAVRDIAQRLPKYKRWDLTCSFWRFREDGLNAQWVLPLG